MNTAYASLVAGVFGTLTCTGAMAATLAQNDWDTNVNQSSAYCSSCGSYWRQSDEFTLSADSNIFDIESELYLSSVSSINYSIWDTGLTTELYSRTFSIGELYREGAGVSNNFIRASFDDLQLSAGTYALSIWNGGNNGVLGWHQRLNSTGTSTQCITSSFTNCYSRGDMTLRIIGEEIAPVPLPAGLPLLVGALGSFVWLRRRRAHKA